MISEYLGESMEGNQSWYDTCEEIKLPRKQSDMKSLQHTKEGHGLDCIF